jgi:predicted nucleic acid-binding Zn ribbon protein
MIERLRDLLAPTLARSGVDAADELFRIGDAWESAVGATIAAHAAPATFRRGELAIAAPEAVWRQELTYFATDIKNKINLALGRELVERVRIVAGDALGPSAPRLERRRSPGAERAPVADDAAIAPEPWPELSAPETVRQALSALHRARERRLAAEARRAR